MMLSQTSKLGCKSWSLQAVDTCPGARDGAGAFVQACEVCYATGGNYRFPAVKNVRNINKTQWKSSSFVHEMADSIGFDPYFVWFDSGDVYSISLLERIRDVVLRTPNTKHWLRTRMWKFPKFRKELDKLDTEPNIVVRYSADSFDEILPFGHNATILTKENPDIYTCPSPEQGNKCLDCRACWDKDVPTVGYKGHGRKFIKLMEKRNA